MYLDRVRTLTSIDDFTAIPFDTKELNIMLITDIETYINY